MSIKSENKKNSPAKMIVDDIFRQLSARKTLNGGDRFWFAISGSWSMTNKDVEKTVRESVREILSRGGGIVSGGALGVDFFATDEALKIDPSVIRVFLPATLDLYAAHYRKRANEGVISHKKAEALIEQLTRLQKVNPDALVEKRDNTEINRDVYFERNTDIVSASDALIAFQVNESEGTGDTISKTLQQGKPVRIFRYTI